MGKTFQEELKDLIAKWYTRPQAGPHSLATHLHAAGVATAAASASGNTYIVFQDEQDANYGNPMGGPSDDPGSADPGDEDPE